MLVHCAQHVGLLIILACCTAEVYAQCNATVDKLVVKVDSKYFVPYEGTNNDAKSEFPSGFMPGYGSGLTYKNKIGETHYFWAITDRGPNGDAPSSTTYAGSALGGKTVTTIAKAFLAPSFAPSIGTIAVNSSGAFLIDSMQIKRPDGSGVISGLPPYPGVQTDSVLAKAFRYGLGNAMGEIPLTDTYTFLNYSDDGLDTESLAYDETNKVFWTSDEYGPFLVKIDANTGKIIKKYSPGNGAADLPKVLSNRRANRGFEGMCLDKQTGKIHAFLQSPIDPVDTSGSPLKANGQNIRNIAKFVRWIEFDPATETTKMYALPINGSLFDKDRTGNAKLGDLVCLGAGKFILIFQGAGKSGGAVFNWLNLVEIPSNPTDIASFNHSLEISSILQAPSSGLDYSSVIPLQMAKLLDLNSLGWSSEKAEGLTMVDDSTLALVNDNDFALANVLVKNGSSPRDFAEGVNVEDNCAVNANTGVFSTCTAGYAPLPARVSNASRELAADNLWLLRFPRSLKTLTVNDLLGGCPAAATTTAPSTTSTAPGTTITTPSATTTTPGTTAADITTNYKVSLTVTLAMTLSDFVGKLLLFRQRIAVAAGLDAVDYARVQASPRTVTLRRLLAEGVAVDTTVYLSDAGTASVTKTLLSGARINSALKDAQFPNATVSEPVVTVASAAPGRAHALEGVQHVLGACAAVLLATLAF